MGYRLEQRIWAAAYGLANGLRTSLPLAFASQTWRPAGEERANN